MDCSKISNLFRKCDWHSTQWFASQEDIREKKYVYLWAKYSLESKRDPAKRKAFKEKLAAYLELEKTSPESLQVWFWDESGFSLRVIRRKTWGKKGSRQEVRGDRRKGRVNVMGAVRQADKKRFVEFLDKGNAANFYKVLDFFIRNLSMNGWKQVIKPKTLLFLQQR